MLNVSIQHCLWNGDMISIISTYQNHLQRYHKQSCFLGHLGSLSGIGNDNADARFNFPVSSNSGVKTSQGNIIPSLIMITILPEMFLFQSLN